jgi:hypothetical protein
MIREVTYTLNGEFVYTGTRSEESIAPGTLLIPKEKNSKQLLRFYQTLFIEDYYNTFSKTKSAVFYFGLDKVNKESDLRTFALFYLESEIQLSNNISAHMFLYSGKELYLQDNFRFFKPLFFDGHSF